MRTHCLIASILLGLSGCTLNEFEIEVSGNHLNGDVRAYLDRLPQRRNVLEFPRIPHAAETASTHRHAHASTWWILYYRDRAAGKLDEGYAYQTAAGLCPIVAGVETVRFDGEGRRIASRNVGLFGLYNLFPFLDIISFKLLTARDLLRDRATTDFGLTVLKIPGLNTCLLRLDTSAIDLLLVPLWRADQSPPRGDEDGEPKEQ